MARVPSDSFGQSRYTEQLLQSVLIPTVVSNAGAYRIETDLSATTLHVDTVFASNVFASNASSLGDLLTETLAVGCQSMQGTYVTQAGGTECLSTTIVGVRAVGNSNAHGTFDGNVIVGAETGLNLCNTNYSVYVGAGAGTYGQATSNVVVGYAAATGISGIPATRGNVIVGAGAGAANTGNSNIFIGLNAGSTLTVSNTLVINNGSTNALIYGQFDSQRVGINCVPTTSFQVSGNSAITGNLSVSGIITGALPASNISGFAPDLHGGGHGVYGGVTLSAGTISNLATTTNFIGGVYLHNSNLSLGGAISNVATTTNFIGGVYLHNRNLSLAGTISNLGTTSNYIGGVYLQNSNLSLAGTISNPAATTNYIGGVYLCNSHLFLAGTITNNGITSNYIGGVYLQNSNLSLAGTISNFATTTNFIGGVYLHNSNLSLGGTISNVASTTNFIGGVYLANSNLSLGGSISNVASTTNFIGGVYLANSNLSLAGTISNVASTTNFIGGVYLHNSNLSLAGTISNLATTTNFIGGVTLSNNRVSADRVSTPTGSFFGPIVTNIIGTGLTYPLITDSLSQVGMFINRPDQNQNGLTFRTFSNATSYDTVFNHLGGISNGSNSSNSIGGVVLCNNQLIIGTLNYLTASYFQIRDSGTQNRFLIGDSQGNNTYELGAFHDNGTLKTFNLDSSTGNISNLSNSSNYIGGVTLSSGNLISPVQLVVGSNSSTQKRCVVTPEFMKVFDGGAERFIMGKNGTNYDLICRDSLGSNRLILESGTGRITTTALATSSIGGVSLFNGIITGDGSGLSNISSSSLSPVNASSQSGTFRLGNIRISWGVTPAQDSGNIDFVPQFNNYPVVFMQQYTKINNEIFPTNVTNTLYDYFSYEYGHGNKYFWLAIGGA